ncbi:tryptophan synthase subunit beta [Pleomorphochaeta sp. DL1XJH-081]|jgi:tryptophan synthase beta chain|uniref:tryptophan synthase subunit beta n=1 Tax=Pleomorphochaeta sp. DL1XJH-081 TaxID=3409690 RepID=UPI003BB7C6BA
MVIDDFFNGFGGSYVAEILRRPIEELKIAFEALVDDAEFDKDLLQLQQDFVGRPTPLLFAEHATRELSGPPIYIKLEGYAHTGAHKINNALGQVLLAKRMGKRRIIAETGAGQHGIATAAACARLGMECVVYMGAVDVMRQQPNVAGMELYGAKVVPVYSGAQTLKDAINEAMRDWAANFQDTHYLIGSALGPAPFPHIVRTFQSVIGRELREQLTRRSIEAGTLVACVGGGSNAIGFFSSFLDDTSVRLIGAEAGGMGPSIGQHAVRMSSEDASEGIIHGYKSRFLVDSDGQVSATHSISAGLDYPGIGPQLAALGVSGRIEYTSASDIEALEAVRFFARNEGVLFALESAHAGAVAMRLARESSPDERPIVINMSGRGEKDLFITSPYFRREEWERFLASELHMVQKREEFK